MGISISGSNAISGLGGNDTDFDKVLSQLKKIEQTQLNRLEAWKSDWNLRYEAFGTIIEQVRAASSMLSQLSDKNNFVSKLVQSSNDNIITAVANASAQDVQHTIKVSQTASNAIWANTGHVFDSKNDVINDTGQDQYFSYTYGGKRHDFKVPPNTSLESFASMLNNSTDNPGVKVSLIQTGNGYVFQVAGKETGVEKDLIIHDSNLVGMKATGSTSTWQTNSSLNLSDTLTDPTSYTYDIVMRDGTKKSVTVKGNATAEELVNALNRSAGGLDARFEDGELTLNALSFTRRPPSEDPYTPPGLRVSLSGSWDNGKTKINAAGGIAEGLQDDAKLNITLTMADGTSRKVEINAGATHKDFYAAIARATQSGDSINVGIENNNWGVNLSGVTGISITSDAGTVHDARLGTTDIEAKGTQVNFGGSITSAETKIIFSKDQLEKQINGLEDGKKGDALVFQVIDKDGKATNIVLDKDKIHSGMSNQKLLDELEAELTAKGFDPVRTEDADGNVTLAIDGVQSFKAIAGSVSSKSFETDITARTSIPATNPGNMPRAEGEADLFYLDSASGKYLLEEAPELKYTITMNDGRVGTLVMPSGSSMKEVLSALQAPSDSRWSWADSDGNPGSVPATGEWTVSFKDADGNDVTDLDNAAGPVTLFIENIQSSSGPGIGGQISASSNWNIQRASNARFQVDNWPVEMESATNSVSDVIEGVVFQIQDVGDARISVSTDITSVEQSIQNFLDAVNSVLITVNQLMAYDEDKEITSNDPDDIGNSNYSPSGLTNQKGGLLMGNYGVQLFKSRFSSVITGTPPGFQSRTSADDLLSGDVLASLANLGIKTDTDATSDTYGLLVIAPSASIGQLQSLDKENYTNLITNNLEAVVDFFCTSGTGSTNSTDFRYGSHVEGITKAGSYEVTYSVDENGQIGDVYIGGVKAKRDESQPGNYYSVASGDARGLSILIDDLSVGAHPPAGSEPMYVRVRQGLVQTTNEFLKGELVFNDVNISTNSTPSQIADAIALKSQNGALMSLRDNYKSVMEGIDVKIEREQRRISTWEARQKAIFANLETLLNQYSEQQSSLEGQLKQLSNNK